MSNGRDKQLTQRQGEYLVAAELCKKGFLATTFSGNVPELDIIAVNEKLETRPVQVKAIRGGSWQMEATRFVKIEFNEKTGKQRILGKAKINYPELKFVLVDLSQDPIEFYILDIQHLRNIIHRHYSRYIEKHKGRRPKTPSSTHTAVRKAEVRRYQDNWDSIFS